MYFHPESNRKFTDHSAIRRAFSDGSMPFVVGFENVITEDILAELGVFPVEAVDSGVASDQIATEGAPELAEGVWRQTWELRAATEEEIAARATQAAADAAAAVPQKVTRRQARQALLLAGVLDDVPMAIAAIPDETQRRLAQIEWEDSLEFERQRPLVISIGLALGLDATALDALFVQAGAL